MRAVAGARHPVDDHIVVEVREPLLLLRRALCAAIGQAGAGLGTGPECHVLVWAIDRDDDLDGLARTHPATRVLALVEQPSPARVNELLAAGARAVLDRGSEPATIASAAIAVARDYVVLPSACISATLLALRKPQPLDADEMRWMRELARGQQVLRLAAAEGYSEREMYRKLSIVYRKLRASGRTEALVALAQANLLDDPTTP